MLEPSYLKSFRERKLVERAEAAIAMLADCRLCPRNCGCDRTAGEKGFCGGGRLALVASCGPHYGEEAPLVGSGGSGTIFLGGCNLLCSFCQNFEISHGREGSEISAGRLAAMMLGLQRNGCHNINFVTPTHFVPQILEALVPAAAAGLGLPLVYNCGGYESVETLRLLDGIIDIYMPDFKFWDDQYAQQFCGTADYRERAVDALREMHRQVGDLALDERGVAFRGLLVRHLVMPNGVSGSREILEFLAREISSRTYVNVMDQYRPCGSAYVDPLINRRITPAEYRRVVAWAREAGLGRLD